MIVVYFHRLGDILFFEDGWYWGSKYENNKYVSNIDPIVTDGYTRLFEIEE